MNNRVSGVSVALMFLAALSLCAKPAVGQDGPRTGNGSSEGSRERIDPETAPRPTLAAFATTIPITIDGRLDESVWQEADSAAHFTQTLPRDGYPASQPTVVRVLYDEHNLYIGATLYDSEPTRLTVPSLEQDFETHNSDVFGVVLDTYLDRQNAFMFGINPQGAVFDAQNFNDSRYTNRAWEGVVYVETQLNDEGWTVEMAIPFTTLRFAPTDREQRWGLNFMRRVRRRNEDSYWAPLARQFRLHKMSRAGVLTGLRHLRQGRNLTVKPYVSTSRQWEDRLISHSQENELDGGVDIKFGVTPRMTLDLTALTDFSQVEVDQEQVNLTRFSLFFPEKRDFFMENDGVFSLGDVSIRNYRTGSSPRDFRLFHSRRIGLSDDRQPLPIAAGARLTGRAGDFEIGLLEMQTQHSELGPAENFAVARIRRNVLGSSDVGVMFINRQGTSDGFTDTYNRSVGVDANLQLLRNMVVNSYFARTDEPGTTGNSNSGWLQVAWRDRVWDTSGFVKYVGDGFHPGVGFIRRQGVRQAFATFGAHPQPNVASLQEINPYVDVSFTSDLDWSLESRAVTGGLGATFLDGGVLSLEYTNSFERLIEPTLITGIEVPPGEFDFAEAAVSYRASGARWISGDLRFSKGSFFDGDKTSIGGSARLRPSYHLLVDLSAEHNEGTLAGTPFTADLYSGRLRYAHSTRLFASAFVQYNKSAELLVTNVRINLIHAPLSDVFLVYTERRDMADGVQDRLRGRGITLKVTKLFGF